MEAAHAGESFHHGDSDEAELGPREHGVVTRGPAALELIRHGQSQGNVADAAAREAGALRLDLAMRDADVELSPLGEQQARALGQWYALRPPALRPDLVLSSPYRRALATARAAVTGGGLDAELGLDERLREREMGVFDGLTPAGVRERYPEELARLRWVGKFYHRPPGGESWCDVALRVRGVLDTLALYPDARVLVVSHQAVIMLFRYVIEGLTEEGVLTKDAGAPLGNCALTRYTRGDDGRLALDVYNDAGTIASMGVPVTAEPAADETAPTAPRDPGQSDVSAP